MNDQNEAARARHESAVRSTLSAILSVTSLLEAKEAADVFHSQPDSVSFDVARRISHARSTGRLSPQQKSAIALMSEWVQAQSLEASGRRRVGLRGDGEAKES